jgi:hypothetical protein
MRVGIAPGRVDIREKELLIFFSQSRDNQGNLKTFSIHAKS